MKYSKFMRTALAALAVTFLLSLPVYAQTLYEKTDSELIARGVTYTDTRRLTTDGYVDFHVITMDMNQDHLSLRSVGSSTEYGKKESAQSLLTSSGAIAGINGDFFGMAGTYSDPFGLVVTDGKLESAGTDRNVDKNQYTTFFMTEEGQLFLDYFNLKLEFLNDGENHIELASMNKISEMKYPIYFDTQAGENTRAIDQRFPNLVKILVQNDEIVRISAKGETVSVPENGYLIILPGALYDSVGTYYKEGQSANLLVKTTVNLENIETAFSGGEWILKDGNVVDVKGNAVVATSRQPRTAIGFSQDQKTVYMVVVDGRGTSIGATHGELAALMKELGAYQALNLDGGGSSTMVTKSAWEDSLAVENTLSEGSQRKIANAIGIFDNAPVGEATQLVVKPADDRVFVGQPLNVSVFGYDSYYHKVSANATISASAGTVNGNTYVGDQAGTVTIKAVSGNMAGSAAVTVMNPVALIPNSNSINLQKGGSTTILLDAVDANGYSAAVTSGITYSLSDSAIGSLNGNVFTATGEGSGTITCTLGNATCTITVSIGGKPVSVGTEGSNVSFSVYPKTLTGSASRDSGLMSLRYQFAESTSTQAAYLQFDQTVALAAGTSALSLNVNGNGSGQWLRARIQDSKDNTFVLDFTKNLDFTGWKTLTANIPGEAVGPFKLESIYIAALSNTDTSEKTLQFKELQAMVPNGSQTVVNNSWKDPLAVDINGKSEGNSYFTIAGDLALDLTKVEKPAEYTDARIKAFQALQSDSNMFIYTGTTDISLEAKADKLTMNGDYRVFTGRGVTMLRVNTSKGGIRATAPSQWTALKADALAAESKHIIFVMDVTPGNFTDQDEAALFRDFMETLQRAGKNVFVVSTDGTSLWSTAKEGVRYVNLPSLWTESGKLNPNAAILRFKVSGDSIGYEIEKLY